MCRDALASLASSRGAAVGIGRAGSGADPAHDRAPVRAAPASLHGIVLRQAAAGAPTGAIAVRPICQRATAVAEPDRNDAVAGVAAALGQCPAFRLPSGGVVGRPPVRPRRRGIGNRAVVVLGDARDGAPYGNETQHKHARKCPLTHDMRPKIVHFAWVRSDHDRTATLAKCANPAHEHQAPATMPRGQRADSATGGWPRTGGPATFAATMPQSPPRGTALGRFRKGF